MNFGSHMDGVVAASAALVNVATPGERGGRAYPIPDAERLAGQIGTSLALAARRTTAPRPDEVAAFVDLAAAVRPVYESVERGDGDAAARTVNALLGRYDPCPRLEHHDGEPWHLHFHGPAGADPSGWGGSMAMGLATVLGSAYADRLGVCAAPCCDRVFVDVSRNGTRRFCGEACQNRVKAAAHRARRHDPDA